MYNSYAWRQKGLSIYLKFGNQLDPFASKLTNYNIAVFVTSATKVEGGYVFVPFVCLSVCKRNISLKFDFEGIL